MDESHGSVRGYGDKAEQIYIRPSVRSLHHDAFEEFRAGALAYGSPPFNSILHFRPIHTKNFKQSNLESNMATNRTISEALGDDHKTIDSWAEKIKSSTTLQEKIEWRNQFTWGLARHAVSEELTVYPAMNKHLGQEGVDLTNVDREQHQAVRPVPLN